MRSKPSLFINSAHPYPDPVSVPPTPRSQTLLSPTSPTSTVYSPTENIRHNYWYRHSDKDEESVYNDHDIESQHESLHHDSGKETVLQALRALGLRGGLALFACLLSQTMAWGLIITYGTILAFYTRHLIPFVSDPLIVLAGGVEPFCCLLLALIWGRLLDAGHHAKLLVGAGGSLTLGFIALAFTGSDAFNSGHYWAIILASFPIGIGMSIFWMTAPQVSKTWMPQRKGLAMGITNSGASIGGVVWPLVFDYMVDIRGFREACFVLAAIVATLSVFIFTFARPAPGFQRRELGQPSKLRTWWPTMAFKSKVFRVHIVAMAFCYCGILAIPYYIEIWARRKPAIAVSEDHRKGHGVDVTNREQLAVYLLICLNASQFPGRVFGSTLCDKFQARKLHILACLMGVSITGAFWFVASSFEAGMVFSALIGLTLGLLAALPVNDVADILGNSRMHLFGQYTGVVYACASLPILTGILVTGAAVQAYDVYIAPAAWAMACFLLAAILIFVSLRMKDDTNVFDEDEHCGCEETEEVFSDDMDDDGTSQRTRGENAVDEVGEMDEKQQRSTVAKGTSKGKGKQRAF